MNTITLGRKPTLGEVTAYYRRQDVLQFILDTSCTRSLVLVIPRKSHWEPDWDKDEIKADNIEQLERSIAKKIGDYLSGIAPEDRPPFYPSIHQMVTKSQGGENGAKQVMDCVFEADLPTWRDSFQDVSAVLGLMNQYGVPYQHKFSGHRSLHITIPAETLPQGYRGKNAAKLAGKLLQWSNSQAHRLPKITRMPYSLNEDTGLVCLPIERNALDAFRPWQANLHLVEVDTAWQNDDYTDTQTNLQALLNALGDDIAAEYDGPMVPTARRFFAVDRDTITKRYRSKLQRLQASGEIGQAWRRLAETRAMDEQTLLDGLDLDDPDAQWLTVEAFLFNGTALSQNALFKLLTQQEEYVYPSAVDAILRFEKSIWPTLVHMIGDLDRLPTVGTRAVYLLTQSESLRERVLGALVQDAGRSHDAMIISACLVGAIIGDWTGASNLLLQARDAPSLSKQDRVRLQALDLMRTLVGWDKETEARKTRDLAALGPDVANLLLIAAGSPSRRFRRGIVSALAEQADPRSIAFLIRALDDDYTKVRRKAIAGLIRIGEPAVDSLIEAAASDQVRIRRYAINCLGSLGVPRAKAAIIQALDDGEEMVRRQAVRALQKTATIEDIEPLKQFLRQALPDNAVEATKILEALGDEGIRSMVDLALQEHNLPAAYFIARQGDDRGRTMLVQTLSSEDTERRDAAVEYLRELNDEHCVPSLIERLRAATDWDGAFIAHELGRIGTPKAVAALIETLEQNEAPMIRRAAVRGLWETRSPVAIEPLIQCIARDPDSKVRKHSVDALAQIGPAVIAPLQQALENETILGRHRQDLARKVLKKLRVDITR
ncbi:MAG: HEAT repeat domain-containing protein [Anaerolineae bacterium]|nr:HEAT repeat domain-containing protein [Anaerolineae bacterium]